MAKDCKLYRDSRRKGLVRVTWQGLSLQWWKYRSEMNAIACSCVFQAEPLRVHVCMHVWGLYHSHFTALFLGPTGWAGARRKLLLDYVLGRITRVRHTNNPGGCHSIRTNQQCTFINRPHFYTRCLPQPSQCILAWDRHRNMLDYIALWLGCVSAVKLLNVYATCIDRSASHCSQFHIASHCGNTTR